MPAILYVFPHPDDESFGPAPAMAQQRRQGHDVHLLTLTRGEATSQREKYGYSKERMGEVRYSEMQDVARALDLASLTVLGHPDGGLDGLDPLTLEADVRARIEAVQPDVLVTYAVHGVSGHPDHLVAHAIVKRVFCATRAEGRSRPKRLAFFTLSASGDDEDRPEHLTGSPDEAIGCVVVPTEEDLKRGEAALDCYKTYQDLIEKHQPLKQVAGGVCFELFQEAPAERLDDLFGEMR